MLGFVDGSIVGELVLGKLDVSRLGLVVGFVEGGIEGNTVGMLDGF